MPCQVLLVVFLTSMEPLEDLSTGHRNSSILKKVESKEASHLEVMVTMKSRDAVIMYSQMDLDCWIMV
jgi:hypothetical protein